MITTEEMPLEDMYVVINRGYTCGQCGGRLNIAWGGSFGINSQVLRCGKDINHNTINRHDRKQEEKIRVIKEIRGMDSTALMKMDEAKMLQRIDMAKFPQDLTVQDKRILVQAAITYGFDPLMGEVSIYQGRPYISIDGRYRKAQETGKLDGVESRPTTKEERAAWQVPDDDYFFRAEVFVKGASHPFVGWGRVRKAETVGGKGFKPIEKDPQRMAEKRAEAQALRKAFHIPLPSAEDIGSPEEEPTVRVVDVSSGEIKESAPEALPEGSTPPAESTPEPTINMDWLKESLTQLQWTDVGKYLTEKYHVEGKRIREQVLALTPEQEKDFAQEVQRRLDGK